MHFEQSAESTKSNVAMTISNSAGSIIRGMGAFADQVRAYVASRRSGSPSVSEMGMGRLPLRSRVMLLPH